MRNMFIKISFITVVILAFSGCAHIANDSRVYSHKASHTNKLTDTVSMITEELVSNLRLSKKDLGTIAVTSFVQLDKLNKTTHFGRVLGESFFNELHSSGLTVMDFRGQKGLSINAEGEFFITRDIKSLKNTIENSYVLVGTYTQIEEGVLINARIMDNKNGKIVASSRVVYNSRDCKLFGTCKVIKTPTPIVPPEPIRTIRILTDDCSKVSCPTSCKASICKQEQ